MGDEQFNPWRANRYDPTLPHYLSERAVREAGNSALSEGGHAPPSGASSELPGWALVPVMSAGCLGILYASGDRSVALTLGGLLIGIAAVAGAVCRFARREHRP
jgi:hypothetical protein